MNVRPGERRARKANTRAASRAWVLAGIVGCSSTPSPLTPGLMGSLGSPAHGTLSAGVELPREGMGYRWFDRRGAHYGLPRLVDAVVDAASEVARARPAGAPLLIGDLSRPHGGRIDHHHSHRSGRDADLLFFAQTLSGEPVPSPGFVKYGADGLAFVPPENGGPAYVRLDLAREWLLIRALMTVPRAQVQWLFISAPLEALLTEYARARGEDPELVWHAESVMQQPSDSLPHDDHLHVRTSCTPEEAVLGCEANGPFWSWLPGPSAAVTESDDALVLALLTPLEGEAEPRVTLLPVETGADVGGPRSRVSLPSRDEAQRGVGAPQVDAAVCVAPCARGN